MQVNSLQHVLICPHCNCFAILRKRGDLGKEPADDWVYVCGNYPKCDSYVGCHQGTREPLGGLANEELRALRVKAHEAFDYLWQSGRMSRTDAYSILGADMGIDRDKAHIGQFTAGQCRRVIELYGMSRPWKMPRGL